MTVSRKALLRVLAALAVAGFAAAAIAPAVYHDMGVHPHTAHVAVYHDMHLTPGR